MNLKIVCKVILLTIKMAAASTTTTNTAGHTIAKLGEMIDIPVGGEPCPCCCIQYQRFVFEQCNCSNPICHREDHRRLAKVNPDYFDTNFDVVPNAKAIAEDDENALYNDDDD